MTCAGVPDEPGRGRGGIASRLVGIAGLVALGLILGCGSRPEPSAAPRPFILFVVLDTVRSDHLSLCGYERPTSPRLEELARRDGAVYACRAYAPGDWTLPSHASFFTGRPVTEHGARISTDGPVLADVSVTPLAERFTTLAEELREDGYRTIAVSGNPVLAEESGLLQGFDAWHAAPDFGMLAGRDLVRQVESMLDTQVERPGEPLFLFVNLAEAHGPWQRIPAEVDWLPERQRTTLSLSQPGSPYRRYVLGRLDGAETVEARERYVDGYDWGVFRADRTFGMLLDVLRRRGRLAGHHRIVVTSDHGEFLAERGLVGHGGFLFEANNRVPVVYYDSAGRPPVLEEPLSGLAPFYLARDGRFPAAAPTVAVAFPNVRRLQMLGPDSGLAEPTSVGFWEGPNKWIWSGGDLARFDLAADPAEMNPAPMRADATPGPLDDAIAGLAELMSRHLERDEELLETLRALGYVE